METESKPACETCAYSGGDYRLECRIKPPSPDYKNYARMFPIVRPDDWCSKYKAKQEPEQKPEPEMSERFKQVIDEWKEDLDG